MKRAFAVIAIVGALFCSDAMHAQEQAANVDAMAAQVDATAAVQAFKKIPAQDKNTAELVGVVLGGAGISSCGVPIYTVGLRVGGQILFAQCAGPAMAATCGRFTVGQRVRLQGFQAQVPDVTTPGFEPCNPATWRQVLPVSSFVATKSLR